jgi:hypothetical protein
VGVIKLKKKLCPFQKGCGSNLEITYRTQAEDFMSTTAQVSLLTGVGKTANRFCLNRVMKLFNQTQKMLKLQCNDVDVTTKMADGPAYCVDNDFFLLK